MLSDQPRVRLSMTTVTNVEDHVWELATGEKEPGLGILHRGEHVKLEVDGDEIEIVQSTSLLHEKSTGAVVWGSTPRFAKWIQRPGRLHDLIFNRAVVELGCGTGALARMVAEKTNSPWTATDQKPLLKLARRNTATLSNVKVVEFDWEEHEFDCKVDHLNGLAPVIVAVDTIYNFYLIDPLLQGIQSVRKALGDCPVIIVVQLRDEQVLEQFLTTFSQHFTIEYFEGLPGVGIYLLT